MLKKDEKKRLVIGCLLLLGTVAFTIASWILLPDAVVVQLKGLSTGVPALPKFFAILIATGMSGAFSVVSFRNEEAIKYTFIGYVLHVVYWICNL